MGPYGEAVFAHMDSKQHSLQALMWQAIDNPNILEAVKSLLDARMGLAGEAIYFRIMRATSDKRSTIH